MPSWDSVYTEDIIEGEEMQYLPNSLLLQYQKGWKKKKGVEGDENKKSEYDLRGKYSSYAPFATALSLSSLCLMHFMQWLTS